MRTRHTRQVPLRPRVHLRDRIPLLNVSKHRAVRCFGDSI
ncbi:hypothetical protein I546_7032 [Mycobacterium kansasii 732]|nr:hypothetical protein I546_7032 [Mycobacterium kansasii 732]